MAQPPADSRTGASDAAGADPRDTVEVSPPDHDETLISAVQSFEQASKSVATLVVVNGSDIGRSYPLRRHRSVLGRSESADLVLQDKQISRAHAAIETVQLGSEVIYRLTDLGSTNHVFVNGARTENQVLVNGDKIQVGSVVLKFELHDAIDARFHSEIRKRIRFDDLTGLLTYESFKTALEWELERFATAAKGCAVVMMDLDDFKRLNDTFGHLAGSAVLHEVGGLIGTRLRQFDVAARYGGEEFVAYLPETAAAEAMTAAERLRRLIAEYVFVHQERTIQLTISMGISHFPQDGRGLEPLIQVADQRLYRAKHLGKNRVIDED